MSCDKTYMATYFKNSIGDFVQLDYTLLIFAGLVTYVCAHAWNRK